MLKEIPEKRDVKKTAMAIGVVPLKLITAICALAAQPVEPHAFRIVMEFGAGLPSKIIAAIVLKEIPEKRHVKKTAMVIGVVPLRLTTAAVVLGDKQRLIPAYRIVTMTGEELQSGIIAEIVSMASPEKWNV